MKKDAKAFSEDNAVFFGAPGVSVYLDPPDYPDPWGKGKTRTKTVRAAAAMDEPRKV